MIFSVPKKLEDLVNDPSVSWDEICFRLETHLAGCGDYKDVFKRLQSLQSKIHLDGPSKALILSIFAGQLDVAVKAYAKVVENQTRQRDVVRLLSEFDWDSKVRIYLSKFL